MSDVDSTRVATLGLFEQRIAGDDCLIELASRRFLEAGMGMEIHGGTTEHLEWVMRFRPRPAAPVVVHLPRDFSLIDEHTRRRICDIASRFAGRVSGMVLHDHRLMAERSEDYIAAARALNQLLRRVDHGPVLFIEYAAGLEPSDFARFFCAIPDLDRIGPCVDIGHVGIRAARAAYARDHDGEDVCALKSQTVRLPHFIADVEAAVASGAAAVLDLVEAISAARKPVHFHLHDGHPLSLSSPFGVSDHLSFLTKIPLNFAHQGRRSVTPMFGPDGLAQIVARALRLMRDEPLSFTLEIHPTGERLTLGDASPLFGHWTDKTNAEQMNHWLAVLSRNHQLLRKAIQAAEGGM